MYAAKPATIDCGEIDQGDLVFDLLLPLPLQVKNAAHVQLTTEQRKIRLAAPASFANPAGDLAFVQPLERGAAIVISNSCDNARRSLPIFLAPVRTTEPSRNSFRLEPDAAIGFEGGWASLREVFVLSPLALSRYLQSAGSRRVCGLETTAHRSLQLRIRELFGAAEQPVTLPPRCTLIGHLLQSIGISVRETSS